MFIDPPGPPINLQASDVTKTSALITFEPPEFDGGSPITGYYVEKKSGTRWVKVNKKSISELSMTLDELIEGTEYEIRVSAENEAGVGKPCEPINFIAKDPYDVPGQPGQPDIEEITAVTASLAWAPPESDGGAPITNYVVEMKPVGEVKWTKVNKDELVPEPKFTVPGLKEETEYEFRVTAENKAGLGPPSIPSRVVKYGMHRHFWIIQIYQNSFSLFI